MFIICSVRYWTDELSLRPSRASRRGSRDSSPTPHCNFLCRTIPDMIIVVIGMPLQTCISNCTVAPMNVPFIAGRAIGSRLGVDGTMSNALKHDDALNPAMNDQHPPASSAQLMGLLEYPAHCSVEPCLSQTLALEFLSQLSCVRCTAPDVVALLETTSLSGGQHYCNSPML
jgi:hypothetical protein